MKKIIAVLCALSMVTLCFGFISHASGNGMTITVSNTSANAGETVDVPIVISNNPGIEAMQLYISYDNGLELKSVTRGSALQSLNFTPSGKYSVYPFVVIWDGMDEDYSNGTLLTLQFLVKEETSDSQHIHVYSEEGMVYNHDLEDIDVNMIDGIVSVGAGEPSAGISTERPSPEPDTPTEPPKEDTVVKITAESEYDITPGRNAEISINIENNTGILGMQLYVEYDSNLTLVNAERGEALSTLEFTPSGNYECNPFVLLWEGMNEDVTNGELVKLTFKTPDNASKQSYEIKVYSNEGMIYDYDLEDITVEFESGEIKTSEHNGDTPQYTGDEIEISDLNKEITNGVLKISMNLTNNLDKAVDTEAIIATYDADNKLIALKSTDSKIAKNGIKQISKEFKNYDNIKYVKIFVWDSFVSMQPLCDSKQLEFE